MEPRQLLDASTPLGSLVPTLPEVQTPIASESLQRPIIGAASPLQIVNVSRFGSFRMPTLVSVEFSQPLDPISATNPANYRLSAPGADAFPNTTDDLPIAIQSVRLGSAPNSVIIRPAFPLRLIGLQYGLAVSGEVTGGGPLEQGAVTSFGTEDFVPSEPVARVFQIAARLQRFRRGPGRLRTGDLPEQLSDFFEGLTPIDFD